MIIDDPIENLKMSTNDMLLYFREISHCNDPFP
jgi:hypothetical protein